MISYHIKLTIKDFFNGLSLGTLGLHRQLRNHLKDQRRSWPKEKRYSNGYFYQGLEEIGITGAKPSKYRFDQYAVDDIIKNARVLDVGSNCGFVACYCAKTAKSVTAIELNPYLNRIARDTIKHLKLNNVDIIDGDFSHFETDQIFDAVLSFSNHHTIDGNLHMGFENYIKKINELLSPGGYLLFESHNVFAAGTGKPGDDGDMNEKIKIMNRYFDIERHRMVRCFLKHGIEDLDKLFIVAKKSDHSKAIDFELSEVRMKYHY